MSKRDQKFIDYIGEIARADGRTPLDAFRSFVLCAACSLSLGTREPEYLDEIRRWPNATPTFPKAMAALVDEMETSRAPFSDLLGPIYMELGSKSTRDWGGEFYTPEALSKAMAKMLMPSIESIPKGKILTVCEPASGAGSMVLALADHMVDIGLSPLNMRVTCVDVSRVACDMCFINMSLWGIPAVVVHGNTLSLEQHAAWRTWCWYHAFPTPGEAVTTEPQTELTPEPTTPSADHRGQFSLFDFQIPGAANV